MQRQPATIAPIPAYAVGPQLHEQVLAVTPRSPETPALHAPRQRGCRQLTEHPVAADRRPPDRLVERGGVDGALEHLDVR
jgi:hypothetical protein